MATKHRLRLQTYQVVQRAVEEGIGYGLARTRKYAEDLDNHDESRAQELERAIMNALSEVIAWPDTTA